MAKSPSPTIPAILTHLRLVELPSADLLRAHAMFATVLSGTILQLDEYIFE